MYRTTIALSTIMFEIKRFLRLKKRYFLVFGNRELFLINNNKVRTQSAKTNTKHQTNDKFRLKQLFYVILINESKTKQ